ncbi:phytoene desaturase family protein [Ferrimicrobium sp.]|uniref:phytoene desaturase family protein n=1 Tax=Ferrimicrobium sp. TaxID=2926050 RepID=UPI00262C942C|nr:phytoene desaturase family protein [Ferrimicrobium sp.]
MSSSVVVVGAGFAGLTAAIELAQRGVHVTVVDRLPYPGGRSGRYDREGFQIDTGPTVFTMPELFRDIFRRAGRDPDEYVTFRKLEPGYHASFADRTSVDGGGRLATFSDRDQMYAEIETQVSRKEAEGYLQFRRYLEELFAVEFPSFIDAQLDSVGALLGNPRALVRLARLRGFQRLPKVVRHYFGDERLQQLFSFQALYAGLSPLRALGIFAIISYMDVVLGVVQPVGGMRAAADGLERLARDLGVEFRYGRAVEAFVLQHQRITSVVTDEGSIASDAVVTSTDPGDLAQMLGRPFRRLGGLRWRMSPSCFLSLRGVRGELPASLGHHNIFFGSEWTQAFEDLVDSGRMMSEPSTLVSVPTRSDPELAPPDSHIVYALEPVPSLDGRFDWERMGPGFVDRFDRRLVRFGVTEELTTSVRHDIDPRGWAQLGMDAGTPFSLAHTFFQSGPFRPTMQDPRISNLVRTGSGTTPGVGLPLVMVSGRLSAEVALGRLQ